MAGQNNYIGILSQKKIIDLLNKYYNLDYLNYSSTAFKNRINAVLLSNNLNIENLIKKIEKEPNFKKRFIKDFQIPDTEMFRDPVVWREIKKYILSNINKKNIKIWIPDFISGDEIFTLAIILKKLNILDKIKVYISSNNMVDINENDFVIYSQKHFAVDEANYKRFNNDEKSSLKEFFTIQNNNYYFDKSLISSFVFINKSIFEYAFPKMDIVIYRNKMIYYNLSMQDKLLNTLLDNILPAGYLIIGVKETIEYNTVKNKFKEINKENGIYKKKS